MRWLLRGRAAEEALVLSEEKESEENKELTDTCKDREGELGKKKVEHEISEGNVATAAAAALASAATKAKVCRHPSFLRARLNGRIVCWLGASGVRSPHPGAGTVGLNVFWVRSCAGGVRVGPVLRGPAAFPTAAVSSRGPADCSAKAGFAVSLFACRASLDCGSSFYQVEIFVILRQNLFPCIKTSTCSYRLEEELVDLK